MAKNLRPDDDRTEIPLRMLTGNLDVLLEGPLKVNTIHLMRDPESVHGVLLLISMTEAQKAEAARRGFKTKVIKGDPRIEIEEVGNDG